MDKYSGCNRVESVSYTPQKQKTQKVKRNYRSFLARFAVACVLVAGVLAVVYIPALAPVRETLKNVICYDMFGREVGTTPIITRLI